MTTYDPDTLDQNITVLKEIVARFDGKLALNCLCSTAEQYMSVIAWDCWSVRRRVPRASDRT